MLAGRGQGGVRLVELVELDERVQQERSASRARRERRERQLVVEGEPRVGLGVADLARRDERQGAHHAAVSERDQPAAGSGSVDERVADRACRLELVAQDQA